MHASSGTAFFSETECCFNRINSAMLTSENCENGIYVRQASWLQTQHFDEYIYYEVVLRNRTGFVFARELGRGNVSLGRCVHI